MDVLSRVRRTIRQHDLAGPGTRVVVALSGGSDSVALAHLLRELERAGELRVAGVAHFNHMLRAGADTDARFCDELAAAFGWTFSTASADVGRCARDEKRSIEDTARRARYEFFERVLAERTADVVALGHTRDDQAETFLLRLLRGAGSRGAGGMHPRRGPFIRPVIDCRRSDLRAYLDARDGTFCTDETNDDVSIPRNRVRAELVPLLEKRFNPSIVDVLADQADLAREEWRFLNAAADALARDNVTADGRTWRVNADALREAPPALARLLLHRVMSAAAGGRTVSFRHVRAALEVIRSEGAALDAPSHRVERVGRFVVLTSKPEDATGRWGRTSSANLFRYPLSIPGEVHVAGRCVVSAEPASADDSSAAGVHTSARVRMDRVGGQLSVRNRRPGDRFSPSGAGVRKKLQDFFVDVKVPRSERDGVPLVVDGNDRIVWVAGHAIDHEFRVTDPAQGVLLLRFRYV